MSQLKVLVAGASIAGPSTAYWFAKAGAKVTVVERFPALRGGGQSVDIRTVGVTVMRKIPGMEASVRANPAGIDGISFVRDDGRPYGTIKPTGNPDQQSLVSEFEIYRSDLAKILYDLTKDDENIRYVFGEQITSVRHSESHDGPIMVEFANGLCASEYDLVVACDGATSRTRAIGFGCDVRDYMEPTNSWAAYFTADDDLLDGVRGGQAYSAAGGRFMAAGLDPSGGTRVVFMAIHPPEHGDGMDAFREAAKQGEKTLKQFIAQHYSGAGWKAGKAIEAMETARDFYANEIVKIKPPSLSKGRVVLVGDAGYAGAAGSGTSLAIAGAYVLAGEISRHNGNLAEGLRGYEETMRPIIDDLQRTPPLVQSFLAPQTTVGVWLRNMTFSLVCKSRILEVGQRFAAGSFANTEKYRLPEYGI